MNKKAVLSTILEIIVVIAFLVAVLIVYFGPEQVLEKVGGVGDWFAERVLFGLRQKGQKSVVESDQSTEETYENILSMLRSEGTGPCILRYKPFPSNFENTIVLSKTEEGVYVQLKDNKGQFPKVNTVGRREAGEIPVPCVIAGEGARNFYNNYLDDTPCRSNCPKDYIEANIELARGSIYVNGEERDLEDNNLVFKTTDKHICFFPTKDANRGWGCDPAEEGLDDDCMDEIERNIRFCGGAEYKEIFFEGTYYGKLNEWRLISSLSAGEIYYYIGTDSRVPYMHRIQAKDDTSLGRKGLTKAGLDRVFSSISIQTPTKPGVYFENVYYDTKDKWAYQRAGISAAWIYKGNDEEVPSRFKTSGITSEEKTRIFGPPRSE